VPGLRAGCTFSSGILPAGKALSRNNSAPGKEETGLKGDARWTQALWASQIKLLMQEESYNELRVPVRAEAFPGLEGKGWELSL
jgi:hypothetical protein